MRKNRDTYQMKAFHPKGYFTNDGYVGFLPDGRRVYFPTYSEYLEWMLQKFVGLLTVLTASSK